MARHEGTIDRHLMQIDADTVVLSITIKEHAELQQWIRTIFDTWDHAAWRERGLLDVTVEILGVFVQYELAELVHWILLARPHLGHVEGIEAKLVSIGFLGIHDLDVSLPCNLFATLDGIPKLSLRVVWVLARRHDSFRLGHLLLPMGSQKVILDVNELAVFVDPLEK